MAEKKKSFSEILNDAPLAAQEDTVTLTGALARSNQPGKFVLAMGPGNTVTLDVDAVKSYQMLGGAVGQPLVQLELDKAKLPAGVQPQEIRTFAPFDVPITTPITDIGATHPAIDNPQTYALADQPPVITNPAIDVGGKFIFEWGGDPYGGDPYGGYGGAAPFALATAHQAPASAPAGLQGNFYTAPALDYTLAWRDVKRPWFDGATGRPPYLD